MHHATAGELPSSRVAIKSDRPGVVKLHFTMTRPNAFGSEIFDLISAGDGYLAAEKAMVLVRKLKKRYPAHLHIDILPVGQRMGIGTALVDRLREKLRSEGIPGVFLICGAKNEKGVNFYRKYGFKEIKKLPGSIIFATEA